MFVFYYKNMKKHILIPASFLFVCAAALAQNDINSSTFSVMSARWLGPGTMSGRITAIAGNPKDGKTVYIGSAGGGVWKTTNGGASFKPMFDKYCQSIGAIALDPQNPDVVYAGTGESNMRNTVSYGDGLYKSTDGGNNWTRIGLDSTEHISKIIVNPKNSNIIYVAVPGPLWSNSTHRGLYKSADGGKTWKKILYANEKTGCADITMNPENPDELLASMWQFRRTPYSFISGGPGSALFKSEDGGKTWKKITKGLPAGELGRIALALSPSNPNHILAIVEAKETKLYASYDGGDSWTEEASTVNVEARPFYFSTIAFDPKDDKRVYRPSFFLSVSDDGGRSFTDASNAGGWVHSDQHAIWINPLYTNQVWLGTDGGVYLSNDRGITFKFISNLPVGQVYHVQVDNKNPYNVYIGMQDNGTWVGPSQWYGGVSNGDWRTIFGGDGFWVQPDLTAPNIVYAEAEGGEAGRVDLKTGLSVDIQPKRTKHEEKLRWNWDSPIYAGTANPHDLYMAAQYLYKSTDQGQDWTRISPDLTTNDKAEQKQEKSGGLSTDNTAAENYCTIFSVAESPLDENYVFAGTDDGNLQITTDGGKTWLNRTQNYHECGIPGQPYVSSIEPSHFDKNTLYATFEAHAYGDFNTYLAKSTDLGKTWTRMNSKAFTGIAHKILEDPVNKNLLFLGTERGLFCSVDGGKSWFRMKDHIPDDCMVDDMVIQLKTNDLVIGSYGRGVLIIDNITPIRNMTEEIAKKNVYLYPMKPLKLTFGNYEGSANGGWVCGNAPEIPPIKYYLKKRLMMGDLYIQIYNDKDSLIRTIQNASKRKGLNEVTWDLRGTPPKVATGASKPDYGGFMAPMVLPGNYIIKLFVAGKVYQETVKLVNDPKSKMTMADRVAQYDAAMQCYRMHEKLAGLADTINYTIRTVSEELAQMPKNKKMKVFLDTLAAFKGRLMTTHQTSIFADEERLREKITDVYGSVCYQAARPTNLQMQNIVYLSGKLDKDLKYGKVLVTQFHEKWDKKKVKG